MEIANNCTFMIIDNDSTNIMVAELIIRKVVTGAQIKSFTLPQLALKYIEKEYNNAGPKIPTFLLLDVYNHAMDGFQFLAKFLNLSAAIKDQFKIIALTAYDDNREMQKIVRYPYVIDYCAKPLTREYLQRLVKKFGYPV